MNKQQSENFNSDMNVGIKTGQQSEQELLEFQKLAIDAKQFLTDHEIEATSDTLAGHMALWIQRRVEAQLAEQTRLIRLENLQEKHELLKDIVNGYTSKITNSDFYVQKKIRVEWEIAKLSTTPQTKEEE